MHTKVISLSNLQQLTTKKYSKLPTKDHQLCLFYHQEPIHYPTYRNQLMIKDSLATSLNICRQDRAWRNKLISIFRPRPIVAIGLCYKTVICSPAGLKTTSKNSSKHYHDPIKISVYGLPPNQLTLSPQASSKKLSKWSHNLQTDSNSTCVPHSPSSLSNLSTNVLMKHSSRWYSSSVSSMPSSRIVENMGKLAGMFHTISTSLISQSLIDCSTCT